VRGARRQFGEAIVLGPILLLSAAILLCGCGIGSERKDPLELKVRDLEREKAQFAGQLEQCEVEIEQLKRQIEALSALPGENRENFYALQAVRITRYTSFYDKDEDGRKEKLIVYVQPIDRDGNVFKAAGIVSVQLWNLDKPSDQALLGQWQIQPAELHKLWFDAFLSTSYRLIFDAPVTPEALAEPLTVKITFTDYLTGQIFTDQHVIEPRLD